MLSLDGPSCCTPSQLPVTAQEIDSAFYACPISLPNTLCPAGGGGSSPTASTAAGLTVPQLMAQAPQPPFAWGPATRCFAPHLHAAELTVAQRALQKARQHKRQSRRHLNRIREWIESNQKANPGGARGAESDWWSIGQLDGCFSLCGRTLVGLVEWWGSAPWALIRGWQA